MPQRGVEAKPAWRLVPAGVRSATEEVLGARVARAVRAWGGYSPTPTFRLRLADGRRAFFKAASPESTEFARAAHVREERVYGELRRAIGSWAPEVLGSFVADSWRVLLLEDLGPKSAPPWTTGLARRVAQELGRFHLSTAGRRLPAWIPGPDEHRAMGIQPPAWALSEEELAQLARLAGPRAPEASSWLADHVAALAAAARRIADPTFSHSLLHDDVRSDNLRWRDGRLYLFDWPHVAVGPREFDVAAFAQAVSAEGGPPPDDIIRAYQQTTPTDPVALDAAVAAIAGYFARHAWLAEMPELPRVRAFQRLQLRVSLRWAARRLGMSEPAWVDRVVVGDHRR